MPPRYNPLGFYHRKGGLTKIMGRIQINTAAIVDTRGLGFTAAYTAAGRITITFDDQFSDLWSVNVCPLVAANNVDIHGQAGAFAGGAAPTLVIRTMTGGVETDVADDDWVCFEATLYSEWLDA